jgi:hypothetical protein
MKFKFKFKFTHFFFLYVVFLVSLPVGMVTCGAHADKVKAAPVKPTEKPAQKLESQPVEIFPIVLDMPVIMVYASDESGDIKPLELAVEADLADLEARLK